MLYCLDTNIVIDLFHGDPAILKKSRDLVGSTCVAPITLAELYEGAIGHPREQQLVAGIGQFMQSSELLDFSRVACELYGKTHAQLRKKGTLVSKSDLMIASVAQANGAVLVTRDKALHALPGIRVEVW